MSTTLSIFALKDWRASLVNASASDWITVAAYLIAALVAVRAARAAARTLERRERLFWALTAALLVFLGINELFDLQTILTAIGKTWALEQGWYADRRLYQFEFILALFATAILVGIAMLWLTRGANRAVRVALLGLVFIGLFVLIRAASFHHVIGLLGMGPDAFNFGAIQEMAGIMIVGLAAYAYVGKPRAQSVPN